MKVKAIVKGVISYILALILTIIFALYLNANVGWYMLIALILAPILSVFFALLTSKTITVDCDMVDGRVSKGDICNMALIVHNKSIFPTTPIQAQILNGNGVFSDDDTILISVLPLGRQVVNIKFKASICGRSTVGIKEIRVTDYLGLFSFVIKKIPQEKLEKNISVIPDVADIAFRDDRILKIIQVSRHGEDSEDTVETDVNSYGGFPGYDNREYVPGDPLKRVNWKLSAKRNKLLVRLDDEMAAQSVNLVLDSVQVAKEPKIAEDAIENALGIAKTLVLSNFRINFYIFNGTEFVLYVIEDDKDVESVRLSMAEYSFSKDLEVPRIPSREILPENSAFVFSTPNRQGQVYTMLEQYVDSSCFSVFSAMEDGEESGVERNSSNTKVEDNKINIPALIIPCLLSVVLSVTVFAAFSISIWSYWTVIQLIVSVGIIALCSFARKYKFRGGLFITILVFGLLTSAVFLANSGVSYTQWFMSGGDVVENTPQFLTTLVLIFTSFFTMVIYYYTQVKYRTSMLLLCSIIPFVVHVKLIRDIEIQYVMFVIGLNVLAFLINNRKNTDAGKRIAGIKSGVLSVVLYGVFFVLIALAVPTSDNTKYYHVFEDRFLGGNTTVVVPEEYSVNSEYSGNADNFNQLTNRKLYSVVDYESEHPLYLRRQVFDYYDFEFDRWYGDTIYSQHIWDIESLSANEGEYNLEEFIDVMLLAEELSPGFLEKYGLQDLKNYVPGDNKKSMVVIAQNFMSYSLITPLGTAKIVTSDDQNVGVRASKHDTFVFKMDYVNRYMSYLIEFYDNYDTIQELNRMGFTNLSNDESMEMLLELLSVVQSDEEAYSTALQFWNNAYFAQEYKGECDKYLNDIPQKVVELALEITKDCGSDWEKAKALENYFNNSDFMYDLEYDAPDDSVEYFLFEGKTGTCSDFASAYVLMARAAGLTARYVEGFVPDREASVRYEIEYVVRTRSSHAYPEVYIPNIGFVVFEPTVAAISADGQQTQDGIVVGFVVTLGYRILFIFAAVSTLIMLILFIVRVLAPIVREQYFFGRVRKCQAEQAVVMIYTRLRDRYSYRLMKASDTLTPYEFAVEFEKTVEFDISSISYMVERVAYENKELSETDRKTALEIYRNARKAIKAHKRKKDKM